MKSQPVRPYPLACFLAIFILFLGLPALARTQTARGAVAGTVTDQTGAALKGAQITIPSQDVNVSSDEQGHYYISNLAPGAYDLKVSYIGLATFTKSVNVTAGQTITLDASLQVASASQSIVVTAARASAEAEAVNEERAADNYLQVLPVEVITSLPNANMADALGRMPSVTLERDEGEGKYVQVRSLEPRLTNTTVDGANLPSEEPGVREIKFDAIPSGIVDSVQISKTLLANMDGDGIGGSVNLVTRTATDIPILEFTSIGGYTPIIHGRGNTTQEASFGRRFGPNKRWGFIVSGSYDWEGRGIDDVEPVPDVATLADGTSRSWFDATDLREYQYFRSRYGFGGSADYRIRDGSNLYARYLYSDFKNFGDRWDYSLLDNTPGISLLNSGNDGCGGADTGPCGGVPSYNGQLRNPDIGVGSLILGGNHVFNTTWYRWEIYGGRSFYGNAASSTAKFDSTLSTGNCQFSPSSTKDKYVPKWTQPCFGEINQPSNFVLSDISLDRGHAAQVSYGAGGSGAWRYHIRGRSATLEYGGKFRNQNKFADTFNEDIAPNGDIGMAQFPNRLINHNYYNGGTYPLGYNVSVEDVRAYADANPSAFTSSNDQYRDPSQFGLNEKIDAAYVMNTVDFGNRVRFIAGLRAETTSDSINNLAFGDDGSITPNSFSGSYYTLLPSASIRFGAGTDSYIRLIYARGLSRPDPQDIAQPLQWSISGNGANRYSVSFGNANLKAETGDDVDLLYDHYFKTFGVISAGYFYKNLQDPIIYTSYQLTNYLPPGAPPVDRGNYLATQPVNAGSAWLSGFETSYLQHFTFLPGGFAGLGLSANYSYLASSTSGIPGRSDHPRLLRNTPNVFNFSPTYDYGRYSARLGVSYNGPSIYAYQFQDGMPGGVSGPLSDIYFYSHVQVDAQGSIGLKGGFSLIVSALNLNNEVFGFYQGSDQYEIQREYYQPTFSAGIHWTANHTER